MSLSSIRLLKGTCVAVNAAANIWFLVLTGQWLWQLAHRQPLPETFGKELLICVSILLLTHLITATLPRSGPQRDLLGALIPTWFIAALILVSAAKAAGKGPAQSRSRTRRTASTQRRHGRR